MDADLSLHPIDVGFDVRLHSMAVSVPLSARTADVEWDWEEARAATEQEALLKGGVEMPYLQKGSGGHVFIEAESTKTLVYFLNKAGYRTQVESITNAETREE